MARRKKGAAAPVQALGHGPLAEKKGEVGSPTSSTIKVKPDMAREAKVVAAVRGVSLIDYIDDILRPVVERDFAATGAQLPANPAV
jgi:hypothetical protein